jgi:hypothetical protein
VISAKLYLITQSQPPTTYRAAGCATTALGDNPRSSPGARRVTTGGICRGIGNDGRRCGEVKSVPYLPAASNQGRPPEIVFFSCMLLAFGDGRRLAD